MPNWVEQNLHVVGDKAEVDRFLRTGFRRRNKEQFDDVLDLRSLCPLKRGEPKTTYTHDSAVVLRHYRTSTQAFLEMITSWDYPAEFYARLATTWPTLGFVCSVNEEMGAFGGIVMALSGEATDVVKDYSEAGYSRRTHGRQVRAALNRWGDFLTADRDWRVVSYAPWRHRSMPVDAHFDHDLWFYFRSRADMLEFRARYQTAIPRRRVGTEWKRTR